MELICFFQTSVDFNRDYKELYPRKENYSHYRLLIVISSDSSIYIWQRFVKYLNMDFISMDDLKMKGIKPEFYYTRSRII
jgi:hypothetical protein